MQTIYQHHQCERAGTALMQCGAVQMLSADAISEEIPMKGTELCCSGLFNTAHFKKARFRAAPPFTFTALPATVRLVSL